MEYVVAKLNEHLIRDISHFKEIMRKINQDTKNDFKCFKDKAVIMGVFLLGLLQPFITDLLDVLVENYLGLDIRQIKLFSFQRL